MKKIENIYCVGRNYALHAEELKNEVPSSPILFSKPNHAAVQAKGQEVILPVAYGSIHYETELVIRIGKTYEKGIKVDEIVDGITVGLDFTLRDVQSELKKKGHPWLLAKGFLNSAVLARFVAFPGVEELKKVYFELVKNGQNVQIGNTKNMLFDLQTIIDYTGQNFGLGEGDLIFTGTPEGVGPVADGDKLYLYFDKELLGSCKIKLS